MELNDIGGQLLNFLQWVGGLAAGTTIAYFMLTHLAGHVFKSSIWLITITIVLILYAIWIQPFIDFWLPALQWEMQLIYKNTPFEMAQRIWDLMLLCVSVKVYALTAHPESHG